MTEPAGPAREAGTQQDLFAVLDSDHRGLLDLAERAETESEPREQLALGGQLVMDTVRHFVAEEQYLFPLLAEHLTDGDRVVQRHSDDHRHIEQALRRLESAETDVHDPVLVRQILAEVRARLAAHAEALEEGLPRLRPEVAPETALRLGEKARGVEQVAPTRPRLDHSDNPAVNKIVSLVEGFVDRVRDSYTHRGVEPADPDHRPGEGAH